MTTSLIHSKNYNFSKNSNFKDYFIYERIAYKQLLLKYFTIPLTYEINIINHIIYNEKSHIVAKFKDYLILDEKSEFLKRYYTIYESNVRLPKFYEYYETYSKIFPNYTGLPEGKYIYINIQKKQIMIDIQEQMEIENKYSMKDKHSNEKINVFNTEVIDSILNQTNKEDIEILFNVNRDNILKEDQIFTKYVIDIINTIEKYENANNNDHSNINIDNIIPGNNINQKSNFAFYSMKRKKMNNKNISNSNSVSNILNKGNSNLRNNIFNIYSYKQKSFNNNNVNYNNNINKLYNNCDRLLFEKLENNLLKLSRKISLTNFTSFHKNKSSNHNLSRQQKISNVYSNINHNSLKSKSNSNNSINNPLSYRICGSSDIIKTPITSRNIEKTGKNLQNNSYYLKNVSNNISNYKNINMKIPNNNSNNIIYIINQNPKFTTNLTFYNNNNTNNTNNNKQTIIHYQDKSNSNNNNSNKTKIKKRNNEESNLMNPSMSTTNILKTTKEIGYKEINLLRNTLKNNIRNNNNFNLKSSKNSSINNKFYLRENSFSRNKKHISIDENHSENKKSKNESMSKLGILDIVNIKKRIIKGIHIKNFSQMLNVNSLKTIKK